MKNIFFSLLTLGIIILANSTVSFFFQVRFIDYSFFVGLAFAVLIKFFNSSGGFAANLTRLKIQAKTGMKLDEEKQQFCPSIALYTAVGYTVISLILMIIYYRNYFFG
jgi:hypothetical protein